MSWLSGLFGGGNTQNPAGAAMPYLDQAQNQYTNPDIFNTIQSQYKQGPAFQHKLQQALEAQKGMAEAGGMSGSQASQQLGASTANDLAEEDFHKYLAERLGISQDMASILGQKAQYGYAGQAGQNQASQAHTNNLLGLLGLGVGAGLGSYGSFGSSPLGFLFGAGGQQGGQ